VSHIPQSGDATTSPPGDAASPEGDLLTSPNCGICDIAVVE